MTDSTATPPADAADAADTPTQDPAAVHPALTDPFAHDLYHIRVKFLKLIGNGFVIRDAQKRPLMYADWQHLRLRQHLRIWPIDARKKDGPLLDIRQRNWSDAWAHYDVTDSRSGQHLGSLRRRAWRSFVRDHWWVLDPDGAKVGTIDERSLPLAFWRRMTSNIWPQTFDIDYGDEPVGSLRDHSSWLYLSMTADFKCDRAHRMDRRLGIAAAVLICADELRTD